MNKNNPVLSKSGCLDDRSHRRIKRYRCIMHIEGSTLIRQIAIAILLLKEQCSRFFSNAVLNNLTLLHPPLFETTKRKQRRKFELLSF